MAAALLLELVKHLETVAVNMHLVDETNVLRRTIITVQDLDVVFLDQPGLVLDARRRRGDDSWKKCDHSLSVNRTSFSFSSWVRRFAISSDSVCAENRS